MEILCKNLTKEWKNASNVRAKSGRYGNYREWTQFIEINADRDVTLSRAYCGTFGEPFFYKKKLNAEVISPGRVYLPINIQPYDEAKIYTKDEYVIIESGLNTQKYPDISIDFPELDCGSDLTHFCTIPISSFKTALNHLKISVGEANRYRTDLIQLQPISPDKVELVSTNSITLTCIECPAKDLRHTNQALIPYDAVCRFALANSDKDIKLSFNENCGLIENEDGQIIFQAADGKFPKWKEVLLHQYNHTFCLLASNLKEGLKAFDKDEIILWRIDDKRLYLRNNDGSKEHTISLSAPRQKSSISFITSKNRIFPAINLLNNKALLKFEVDDRKSPIVRFSHESLTYYMATLEESSK